MRIQGVRALDFGRFLGVLILVPGCFPGRFVLGSSFLALRVLGVLGVLKALGGSATIGRYAASDCLALLVACRELLLGRMF